MFVDFPEDPEQVSEFVRAGAANGVRLSVDDVAVAAQLAATKSGLARGVDDDLALVWTRTGVLCYDRLAAADALASPFLNETYESSGMRMRVWAIQRFGPVPGDRVRDPLIVANWLSRLIREQMARQGSVGESVSLDDMDRWHWIGQMAQVVQPLVDLGLIQYEPRVKSVLDALAER